MRLKALLDSVVSSFLPPPLIFIGVDRGLSAGDSGASMRNRLEEELWRRHIEGKVGGAQPGLAELVVRPNWPWLPPPHPLAGWLPSRPLHRFWVLRAKLSQFTSLMGPLILVLAPDWPKRSSLGLRGVFS
jgi:hypothetical protein